MSNYRFSDSQKNKSTQPRQVHPVMRGIGCVMMIIIPFLSYIAANELVENGFGRQVLPPALYEKLTFPPLLYQLSGIVGILNSISSVEHLPANLVLTTVFVVVVGGLMSVVYGYVYEVFGPPKYGPTDAPPPRGVKVKRYKR